MIRKLILIILLVLHVPVYAITTLEAEILNSFVDQVDYKAPSDEDLQQAQMLFRSILKHRIIKAQDVRAWHNIGMNLKLVRDGVYNYAVISEKLQHTPKGYGFYTIKLNSSNTENILQAPHKHTDLYTDQILFQLFMEGNYLAAAWNTTLRLNVDFCKEPKSFFNSFTIAVAEVMKKPRIIQLHSFDSKYHNIDADVIISSSTKIPKKIYSEVANCLKNTSNDLTLKILLYPDEVRVLGGTLNINANKFYSANSQGLFFHIETNKLFRRNLKNNKILRDLFNKCLVSQ